MSISQITSGISGDNGESGLESLLKPVSAQAPQAESSNGVEALDVHQEYGASFGRNAYSIA